MERSTGKDRSRRKVNGVTRHGQVDRDRASNRNNKFGSTTLPKWLVPREIKKAKPEVSDELVGWILYGFARVHPFVRELTKAVSIGQPHWTGCIPIPASASQVKTSEVEKPQACINDRLRRSPSGISHRPHRFRFQAAFFFEQRDSLRGEQKRGSAGGAPSR